MELGLGDYLVLAAVFAGIIAAVVYIKRNRARVFGCGNIKGCAGCAGCAGCTECAECTDSAGHAECSGCESCGARSTGPDTAGKRTD